MYYRQVLRILGYYLYFFAAALSLPLGIAVYYQWWADTISSPHPQPHTSGAFLFTIVICLVLASIFYFFGKGSRRELYRKEGLLVVICIWFVSGILGALPFVLSSTLAPVDAFFETVSGFTSTGASILESKAYNSLGEEIPIVKSYGAPIVTEYSYYGTIAPVVDKVNGTIYTGVEALGKGLLFWRQFMQWLGGVGIVVLLVAIFPAIGVGGKLLYETESSGPTKEGVTPRIQETAGWLWKIYLLLSLALFALLLIFDHNIQIFDALCLTFSTISTGGFAPRNASIGYYNSPAIEWIVTLFMFLGSINFTLYFYFLKGRFYRLYHNSELRLFLSLSFIVFAPIAWNIAYTTQTLLTGPSITLTWQDAIRYAAFQAVSIQSSCGFATIDFDKFPYFSQTILLLCMYLGGMSGSTTGGIKTSRLAILGKATMHRLEAVFKPEQIRKLRLNNQEVSSHTTVGVLIFFFLSMLFSALGTILLVLNKVDVETAMSTIACMINNAGIAFRIAGPTGSFAFLSPFGKLLSCLWMVLGRLEIYVLLAVLLPTFWKKQ